MASRIRLAIVFLAISACANSQTPGDWARKTVRISGKVVDSAERPIQYEAVELRMVERPEAHAIQVPTDVKGHFAFTAVLPDKYTLTVKSYGFVPLTQPVDASAGRDTDVGDLRIHVFACDMVEVYDPKHPPRPLRRPKKVHAFGRVVDQTGVPVPKAQVDPVGECYVAWGGITNKDGIFTLPQLGPFTLRVRGAGFLPVYLNTGEVNETDKKTDLGTIVVTR